MVSAHDIAFTLDNARSYVESATQLLGLREPPQVRIADGGAMFQAAYGDIIVRRDQLDGRCSKLLGAFAVFHELGHLFLRGPDPAQTLGASVAPVDGQSRQELLAELQTEECFADYVAGWLMGMHGLVPWNSGGALMPDHETLALASLGIGPAPDQATHEILRFLIAHDLGCAGTHPPAAERIATATISGWIKGLRREPLHEYPTQPMPLAR
jgi:hypothetical protein